MNSVLSFHSHKYPPYSTVTTHTQAQCGEATDIINLLSSRIHPKRQYFVWFRIRFFWYYQCNWLSIEPEPERTEPEAPTEDKTEEVEEPEPQKESEPQKEPEPEPEPTIPQEAAAPGKEVTNMIYLRTIIELKAQRASYRYGLMGERLIWFEDPQTPGAWSHAVCIQ